ncbi:hypothetical protein NMY22_g19375 [Coprinellus aureogranulatus]|nr:hypothetical protein NMY22_g19375 [Coprinellus aureogranulatus]
MRANDLFERVPQTRRRLPARRCAQTWHISSCGDGDGLQSASSGFVSSCLGTSATPNFGCMAFSESVWLRHRVGELMGFDFEGIHSASADSDLQSLLYRIRVLPLLRSDLPKEHLKDLLSSLSIPFLPDDSNVELRSKLNGTILGLRSRLWPCSLRQTGLPREFHASFMSDGVHKMKDNDRRMAKFEDPSDLYRPILGNDFVLNPPHILTTTARSSTTTRSSTSTPAYFRVSNHLIHTFNYVD